MNKMSILEFFKGTQKQYNEALAKVEDSSMDLTIEEKEEIYNILKNQITHENITLDTITR